MSAAIGTQNPAWDLSISKYPEIDDLPLMKSPGPVLMIIAVYLLFVLRVGPALMKKKEPYKLTKLLLIYNAIQVAYSLFLVIKFATDFWHRGVLPKTCHMKNPEERSEIIFGIWLYFAAKISELLDTLFFVFRKKFNQITFLHLYHHCVMAVGTWMFIKYFPTHTLFFIGFLNSLIHVLMYSYYGLAALGPSVAKYLTWKKYMTTMQLIQFVMILIHYMMAVNVSDCPPPTGPIIFTAGNTTVILLLFLNFYRQTYTKTKSN